MEAGGSYNQTDAEGFLRIMGLPLRVQGRVRPRMPQNRVQGHPGGECRGACVVFWPLCPPEARLVGNCRKEHVSKPRTTCRMPSPTRGEYEASGWIEGVVIAGSTKRTSVVSHGSSWKRFPAARG